MAKNKIFYAYVFYLSLAVIFLPGCVYLTHWDEVRFMKGLEASQKEMQAELDREQKLYNKLKADIDNGRLDKLMQKRAIFRIYGEPTLCRPAQGQGQSGVKESCIYRNPAGEGLLAEIILLNLDARERLSFWEVQ
ncbi:MAG: hypothetical protein PHE30_02255 [Candidatus Omnitrophica bacterium]|nr:hypothetical protein [Candidatus Omnitrophota bacterium]MDD5027864.1 hypothetical protein [Candidatus Omnitrophota bacterium]MDD5662474.1 hypothetical protein [Candidatus Omnitrophota bacterium]